MPQFIPPLDRLPAFDLADRARAATDLVPMAGVPVLAMAEHVVAAASRAAGQVSHRLTRGHPALREALAAHLGAAHGLRADPEREILITHGAQQGMSVALRALLSAGDEVLIPAPTYFFDGMVRMAGARPVYVPTLESQGWAADLDALSASVTPATRALLLCNPNNPTGHTPTREQVAGLLDLAAAHGLIVFSDESYARYVHDGPGYVPQQLLRDRWPELVTVTSLSKNYAFTQWRVGYVHAPAHLLDAVHRAFEWDAINVGDVPQAAAHAVITGPQEWLDVVYGTFRRRRDLLFSGIEAAGLRAVRPDSGIFVFTDFSVTGLGGRELENALLAHGVTGIAGDAFRGPADHARLLYGGAEADLVEVGRRLAALVGQTRRQITAGRPA